MHCGPLKGPADGMMSGVATKKYTVMLPEEPAEGIRAEVAREGPPA